MFELVLVPLPQRCAALGRVYQMFLLPIGVPALVPCVRTHCLSCMVSCSPNCVWREKRARNVADAPHNPTKQICRCQIFPVDTQHRYRCQTRRTQGMLGAESSCIMSSDVVTLWRWSSGWEYLVPTCWSWVENCAIIMVATLSSSTAVDGKLQ